MFLLCEPFGRHVLRWSGSVTYHHYFLLLSQTYVLGNVRSELFLVYGCLLFILFFKTDVYTYLFYLISKGIFHLGGLVSKVHISVYMLFTEWKCFCFFSFIEYNLGIMNIQCIL